MKILPRIRAFFVMIEFVVTVLITIVLMYLFRNRTHGIRKTWANLQTYLIGFKIVTHGDISPKTTLLVMNHQSLLDIVTLEAIYPKNLCWIAKKEIEDIPLFGHIIPAPRMISIDRKDKRSIIKMLKEGKERVSEGRVLAMFPEGTRGRGDKLLKFQSGAKALAEKLDLVVQPALITGARYVLDSQNFMANGGEVHVHFLDPIDPKADEQWFEKMYDAMNQTLQSNLNQA
ncbi:MULTISPECIES: 1-acyl-sn-glycerol-3-phosphate acyltransferase [Sulfurospirillum]|uniref:lysophospholipid acyltransferase family protein n=1 Tax=Sulfurospirillum TaxID=57665 RepID=UPI000764A1B6|nr:lysophospholipid acyltransferase family protein [Sulfurospirillum cavolei]MCD8544978.1 1-acyl-sn-glycerol-3-phosphate acyltransferase [Sulfurospirillum cavolei]MCP3650961.1 1-acyl-sn-glycerol-3-phosphate acyltransferase [Sulfurospirillum sp. DNRA8]MCR1809807.1 1-acyl-sn-glycerol-3-phosphate acyltransferase [Sulfurospirillum sp. DNRA8]